MRRSQMIEDEVKYLKSVWQELELYIDNSFQIICDKIEKFSILFETSKNRISSMIEIPIESIKSDLNTSLPLNYNKENCAIDQSNSTTPNKTQLISGARYPIYVSPSLHDTRKQDTCFTMVDYENINLTTLSVIFSYARGLLTKQLYNSRNVLTWRDTIQESEKLLLDLPVNVTVAQSSEMELRQRLLSEIDAHKSKIYQAFFEYTSSQKLKLIRQSFKASEFHKRDQNYTSSPKMRNKTNNSNTFSHYSPSSINFTHKEDINRSYRKIRNHI